MKVNAKSAETGVNGAILGTYSGECADANITNANGLDITRPVWENVFASDEYAKGIELGHYIGFLGHPEDPGCQEFEKACIVMTEGHIDDDGKVYGQFNLIDTPVGRVVTAFQDAGVKFGISVRGAGDIIDNSVDPDTFCFRGFDLVAFPAYPDAVPEFTKIAASTDTESKTKYNKICAAVNTELPNITSVEALDIIQSQFAQQSDEYKAIEVRKSELSDEGVKDTELEDINDSKVECVTKLYIEAIEANKKLEGQLREALLANAALKKHSNRKISSLRRISACQLKDLDVENTILASNYDTVTHENQRLKDKISALTSENLKYKHKISSNNRAIEDKDSVIARLQSKIDETVVGIRAAKADASNRDEELQDLKSEIKACKNALSSYQRAYAQLYATAVGVDFNNQPIMSSTSVQELQRRIKSDSPKTVESNFVEATSIELDETVTDDGGLVTM